MNEEITSSTHLFIEITLRQNQNKSFYSYILYIIIIFINSHFFIIKYSFKYKNSPQIIQRKFQ